MKSQKFHSNRIIYLILTFLFLIIITDVKALVKPTTEFYINDYANVLSDGTGKYILNKMCFAFKTPRTTYITEEVDLRSKEKI